ncbi:uncharacterized protein SOCE26_002180 [Sorangium cellulosum]|uniref:SnoaL-like domain-containing protein n=1 Tax=Sorangium cellulosum TaxID=56 RepID=A0A2L0EHQ6_SORCE|nr:nuclear transport factor 2 family protein [Sorangium cellulosum]AUX38838.1 uncharacterized protein SOCE26_002180 [Sorangium cellulosum]
MNLRRALVLFALPLLVTSCQSQAPVVSPRSIGEELLTELWAKVYNPPQDLSAIDRLCTEDFILTTAGTDVVGRDAFKAWAKSFSSKIGDMRLTSVDMFSSTDGKRVVSRWKVTGRNLGLLGTHADNRPIEFTGIAVWEVRDGKLAHNWVERSAYELEQRLKQPAE